MPTSNCNYILHSQIYITLLYKAEEVEGKFLSFPEMTLPLLLIFRNPSLPLHPSSTSSSSASSFTSFQSSLLPLSPVFPFSSSTASFFTSFSCSSSTSSLSLFTFLSFPYKISSTFFTCFSSSSTSSSSFYSCFSCYSYTSSSEYSSFITSCSSSLLLLFIFCLPHLFILYLLPFPSLNVYRLTLLEFNFLITQSSFFSDDGSGGQRLKSLHPTSSTDLRSESSDR